MLLKMTPLSFQFALYVSCGKLTMSNIYSSQITSPFPAFHDQNASSALSRANWYIAGSPSVIIIIKEAKEVPASHRK